MARAQELGGGSGVNGVEGDALQVVARPPRRVSRMVNASEMPLWLYVLERFGVPTLFAVGTAAALILYNQQSREDLKELRVAAREERGAFMLALKANTAAIDGMGGKLVNVAEVLRMHIEIEAIAHPHATRRARTAP